MKRVMGFLAASNLLTFGFWPLGCLHIHRKSEPLHKRKQMEEVDLNEHIKVKAKKKGRILDRSY